MIFILLFIPDTRRDELVLSDILKPKGDITAEILQYLLVQEENKCKFSNIIKVFTDLVRFF